ncbi:ribosome maturation factor RimM [bacterium]|nr:ribosome maturation factor RimM [bacterium]
MDLKGIIQIGQIVNSHGIKGEVKVIPLTEDLEIFENADQLIISENDQQKRLKVIKARQVKKHWLILFAEVQDLTSAQQLKGRGIFIEEERIKPLNEDEFFIHDLLDSKVYSTDNEYLGIITHYFEAGPQGVCEVTHGDESFMFPTSREVLKEIIPSDKVVIQLLPGLREVNK